MLDLIKSMINTKPNSLNRAVAMECCINDKSIIDRVAHYGDSQDIFSDDNVNAEIEIDTEEHRNMRIAQYCR